MPIKTRWQTKREHQRISACLPGCASVCEWILPSLTNQPTLTQVDSWVFEKNTSTSIIIRFTIKEVIK